MYVGGMFAPGASWGSSAALRSQPGRLRCWSAARAVAGARACSPLPSRLRNGIGIARYQCWLLTWQLVGMCCEQEGTVLQQQSPLFVDVLLPFNTFRVVWT